MKRDQRVGELWAVARALEGCTRHASVHASAVVISDEPLMERVPLYKDPKRPELITGFAMGPIEKLGLLKMDFLGLRTLTVIADAARLVKESKGIALDPESLPLDDFAGLPKSDDRFTAANVKFELHREAGVEVGDDLAGLRQQRVRVGGEDRVDPGWELELGRVGLHEHDQLLL